MNRASAPSAALVLFLASTSAAQVSLTDYQRAQTLRDRYESAAGNVPDAPTWIPGTHRFYYRRTKIGRAHV